MRLSFPPPGRFKRAVSSGRLDCDEKGRKVLSFKDRNVLEIPLNTLGDEVASDDDKNQIELIQDQADASFDLP
jgi:hypothetical protein